MPEWLTYAQAGERFGMSADAVRMRAHRLGWRMQPGNDGRTLILIPDDAAIEPRTRPPAQSAARSDERSPAQDAEIARLMTLLTALMPASKRLICGQSWPKGRPNRPKIASTGPKPTVARRMCGPTRLRLALTPP